MKRTYFQSLEVAAMINQMGFLNRLTPEVIGDPSVLMYLGIYFLEIPTYTVFLDAKLLLSYNF